MTTSLVHPTTGKVLFWKYELMCSSTEEMMLDPHFSRALINLRMDFARPMRVNSCCRSWSHNKAIKGHERSLHVYDEPWHTTAKGTMAIDIHTGDSQYSYDLARCAMNHGWAVGFNPKFLHLDRRLDLGMDLRLFSTS